MPSIREMFNTNLRQSMNVSPANTSAANASVTDYAPELAVDASAGVSVLQIFGYTALVAGIGCLGYGLYLRHLERRGNDQGVYRRYTKRSD